MELGYAVGRLWLWVTATRGSVLSQQYCSVAYLAATAVHVCMCVCLCVHLEVVQQCMALTDDWFHYPSQTDSVQGAACWSLPVVCCQVVRTLACTALSGMGMSWFGQKS